MRLDRLDLIRFGKFTDTPLAFPASECDLHLIVVRRDGTGFQLGHVEQVRNEPVKTL